MRKFNSSMVLGSLALACVAGTASGVTITFEGHLNTIYNAPITRSGFEIGNPVGQEQHFHEIDSTQYNIPNNGTGILLNDRNTQIYVVESFFDVFTMVSVDVATSGFGGSNNAGIGLDIHGYLNNVHQGTITIANLGSGWTTVNGGALGNVDKLLFDGFGGQGGFSLDNLTLDGPVNPGIIPLPGAGAMGLAGLGVAGALRRRRMA